MMRNGKSVQTFFTLTLLLLFGISMFLCVLYELNGYQKMDTLSSSSQKDHLPSAYLSQKMRSAKKIDIENDILLVSDDSTVTYIYFYDGFLCELTVFSGYDFDPSYGEKLFEIKSLDAKKEKGKVVVNYVAGEQKEEVIYSLRGREDE